MFIQLPYRVNLLTISTSLMSPRGDLTVAQLTILSLDLPPLYLTPLYLSGGTAPLITATSATASSTPASPPLSPTALPPLRGTTCLSCLSPASATGPRSSTPLCWQEEMEKRCLVYRAERKMEYSVQFNYMCPFCSHTLELGTVKQKRNKNFL